MQGPKRWRSKLCEAFRGQKSAKWWLVDDSRGRSLNCATDPKINSRIVPFHDERTAAENYRRHRDASIQSAQGYLYGRLDKGWTKGKCRYRKVAYFGDGNFDYMLQVPTYLPFYLPTYLLQVFCSHFMYNLLDNFNDYYIRGLHYNNLDSFWLSIFIRGLNCNTVDNVWLVIGITPWFVMQDLDHITSLHIGNKLW